MNSNRLIKFLDENNTRKLMTPCEVAAMCNFTWQETISGMAYFPKALTAAVQQEMASNLSQVVLTKLPDPVGYGVLCERQGAAIQANLLLCVYAGELKYYPNDFYSMDGVSASRCGNMARFFSHLPTKLEVLHYQLKGSLKYSDIATANLHTVCVEKGSRSKKFNVLATNTVIQPGEIMGLTYGDYFWEGHNIEPKLLNKSVN